MSYKLLGLTYGFVGMQVRSGSAAAIQYRRDLRGAGLTSRRPSTEFGDHRGCREGGDLGVKFSVLHGRSTAFMAFSCCFAAVSLAIWRYDAVWLGAMRPRIAMFVVLSRARADGGCLPGWTQLGEECFKASKCVESPFDTCFA